MSNFYTFHSIFYPFQELCAIFIKFKIAVALFFNWEESKKLFGKRKILDSSKQKDFADDNLKFNENSRQFSKWVENTGGKGEIARYE